MPTKYIREHISLDSVENEWLSTTPAYHLSYAENINKSLSGIVGGAHWFDGSRQQIALTLPAAPVAEVQVITPSATVTAGSYRFLYKGQLSTDLPFNATVGAMAAAFAAIKGASSRFVTCTFSQTLSTAGAITCTFVHPQNSGLEGDLLQIVGNGIVATCTSTLSVSGTAGLANGQYDVSIYSFVFRRGSYANGTLHSALYTPK